MIRRPYVIADVFTDTPLEGNGLAVFPRAGGLDPGLMQRTARELNLSEMVFVTERRGDEAAIRIFTPTTELPFAGHPVLGTAYVLGEEGDATRIVLRPPAGHVPVALTRSAGGEITFGEMEQPVPEPVPFSPVSELLGALGVAEPVLPVAAYCNGPVHVCVCLPDPVPVTKLAPDFTALAELGPLNVSCFAPGGAGLVVTRMFAPGIGVLEDPATGSAAGPLAVHLARHGLVRLDRRITISQGAQIGRPSVLYALVAGTAQRIERVAVGGQAVIVARGEYRLS